MFKSANTTLMVTDFKKSVQFYVETLELKLQSQIEGHLAQVEAPGLTLWLIHPDGDQQPHQQGNSDSISIGFEVNELNSTVELLKSRGVEFNNFMETEATRFAYFNDPDSNPLYLIELKLNPGVTEK